MVCFIIKYDFKKIALTGGWEIPDSPISLWNVPIDKNSRIEFVVSC